MSAPEDPTRLDPDLAIEEARGAAARPPRLPPPVIDTRRYQRMIGAFGLVLLVAFSIVLYASNGSGTPGVAAGQRLHRFVAPLATSNLSLPANAHPRCNPSRPSRRGLNVCGRRPIVLAFFAPGHGGCVRAVDSLQALAPRFRRLQFAAVAVSAGHAETRRLVRRHGWTIPVAFDLTGAIGQIYGIVVCPIIELAGPGGVVSARLIGERWDSPSVLAGPVSSFARSLGTG